MPMAPSKTDTVIIREATVQDIETIARHRCAMFEEMGRLDAHYAPELHRQTAEYLRFAIPGADYRGWLAHVPGKPMEIVGGAGMQVRWILPRPSATGGIQPYCREGLVINVWTDPAWRQKGVARQLMETLHAWAESHDVFSVVLHASDAGRPLYEQLGYVATNEMRYTWPGKKR